jgi:hypothetical protein
MIGTVVVSANGGTTTPVHRFKIPASGFYSGPDPAGSSVDPACANPGDRLLGAVQKPRRA